ncbi:glycosyltransferase [Gracilimonas sp.]|uniref:glycosyltransferase n=1 Tax=Gracilimonas sp. TaxID=1974203 RepID=UPI003BAD07D8
MKNVLFIVYYFPPMGGSGVQRPLKFAKYLRDFGWNPIVLCPEPGAYHTFDESLEREVEALNLEVHRVEANTPFHRTGQSPREVKVPGTIAKILRWFSTFFFIPDNKKSWIEPGLEKALKLVKEKNIVAVFASGPPHSNLMLAQKLKEETGIPVVMDLRDDWVESHLIKYPTALHKKKMEQLEIDTLTKADALLTINEEIAKSIRSRVLKSVEVIGHGYDPEDFESAGEAASGSPRKLKFLYSGTFYPESTPDSFLKAVYRLLERNPELKEKIELQFQGGLNPKHWKVVHELDLTSIVLDFGYVDHDLAVKNLMNADVLWLNIGQKKNPEIISLGKTSEYFATKKPILGLVPEGSAKTMLEKYGKAFIADPYDIAEITEQLSSIVDCYQKATWPEHSEEIVDSYNRKKMTGKLAEILNEISVQ